MCTIIDLVMGDTRKLFHDCNCIFTYVYVIFSITYIRTVRVFYSEGDVRSFLGMADPRDGGNIGHRCGPMRELIIPGLSLADLS